MDKPILYLGDTALREAACYLAGVMSHFDIGFDYHPSDRMFDDAWLLAPYCSIILSDYPSRNISSGQMDAICERVEAGMGFAMIGGWESFTGAGGDFGGTRLADILPVALQSLDDRINWAHPCLVRKMEEHSILKELPFDEASPVIGGYNRVSVKPGGILLLSAQRFLARKSGMSLRLSPIDPPDPLLVIGQHGRGRVAAYTSDAAPHWVGGMVDWGDARISACAPGSIPIEVGIWYARFFAQLIRWCSGI